MEEEEDGDHLYTVKGRRQRRRKRGRKITRYKYSKGKESQKEEEKVSLRHHISNATAARFFKFGMHVPRSF